MCDAMKKCEMLKKRVMFGPVEKRSTEMITPTMAARSKGKV